MNRRNFLNTTAGASIGATIGLSSCVSAKESIPGLVSSASVRPYPLAITMWEFSWLERRWPGAGYEDWDQALSELVERGYDAIRIDAFPHLIYNDPDKDYLLYPQWSVEDWGSPEINRVRVQPNLNLFLEKCSNYNIRVGLSSWFREDEEDVRMKLDTPEKLGRAWLKVLESIDKAGLLDTILYVDLCNEWTGPAWSPYFINDPPEAVWSGWDTLKSQLWMKESISLLKNSYPSIPYTFSLTEEVSEGILKKGNVEMLDLLEQHIWMTSYNGGEFYREVGYEYERFSNDGYRKMVLKGESTYSKRAKYWQNGLVEQIRYAAEWSRLTRKPLVTTECWGVVNFKDWPLLDWGYIKELCALGTEEAAKSGRWLSIGTSNFCGPQFVGMWRDIEWHRRLTDIIHDGRVDKDLKDSLLAERMIGIAGK